MMAEDRGPIIAFVWRPEEITPPVTQMAHRTGSRAIFDFSMMERKPCIPFCERLTRLVSVGDIKISAVTLMDPSLGRLLKEGGVQNIWVECHPQSISGDTSGLSTRD